MKVICACLAFTFLVLELHAPPTADACGVKLIKTPGPRKARRQPIKTEEPRPIIAARPQRQPIAAGPPQPERRTVAAKPKQSEPKPTPEPAPEPTGTTRPAPTDTQPTTAIDTQPTRPADTQPTRPADTQPAPTPAPKAVAAVKHQEVFFKSNSSAVGDKSALDRVARWMKSDPNAELNINGHADPSGNPDSNMTLSRARAEAVRDYLVAAGIDESRLHVDAHGDTQPKYGKKDGRNRRVELDPKK